MQVITEAPGLLTSVNVDQCANKAIRGSAVLHVRRVASHHCSGLAIQAWDSQKLHTLHMQFACM